jgi:hypothetical protein
MKKLNLFSIALVVSLFSCCVSVEDNKSDDVATDSTGAGNPITEHSEIKGMEVVDKIDIPTEGTLYKVQDGAC